MMEEAVASNGHIILNGEMHKEEDGNPDVALSSHNASERDDEELVPEGEEQEELAGSSKEDEGSLNGNVKKAVTHKVVYRKQVENYDINKMVHDFWPSRRRKMENMSVMELREASRNQDLPLARVKKIMKLDENVKKQMISSDAPLLLSLAAELFVEELSLRSWEVTESANRKTLQKTDVSVAVSRNEHMDFLIDIIPRIVTGGTSAPPPPQPPTTQQPNTSTPQHQTPGPSNVQHSTSRPMLVRAVKTVDGRTVGRVINGGPSSSHHFDMGGPSTSSATQEEFMMGDFVATPIGQPIQLGPQTVSQLRVGGGKMRLDQRERDPAPHRSLKTVGTERKIME